MPQTLNPYPYVLNNPVNLTDPSGELPDVLLDIAFIAVDLGFMAWDSYHIVKANPCETEMWQEQLRRDSTMLLLDVVCAFIPGITGGGRGMQWAFAGGGRLIASGAIRLPRSVRVAQTGAKVAQARANLAWFAKRGGSEGANKRSPHKPGFRIDFDTRKGAFEAAKKAGKGRKPVHHPHGAHGPHFHAADAKGRPLNHNHYYYPKRFR